MSRPARKHKQTSRPGRDDSNLMGNPSAPIAPTLPPGMTHKPFSISKPSKLSTVWIFNWIYFIALIVPLFAGITSSSSLPSLGGAGVGGGGTGYSVASGGADKPYFDDVNSRNVTAIVEDTAVLRCRVKHKGDRTVSWGNLSSAGQRCTDGIVLLRQCPVGWNRFRVTVRAGKFCAGNGFLGQWNTLHFLRSLRLELQN